MAKLRECLSDPLLSETYDMIRVAGPELMAYALLYHLGGGFRPQAALSITNVAAFARETVTVESDFGPTAP